MNKIKEKRAYDDIKPMKSTEFRKLYYAILRSLDRVERKTVQMVALCKWHEENNKNLEKPKH